VKAARIVFVVLAGWLVARIVAPPVFAEPQQKIPPAWVGTWTAPQYKVPAATELDISVWGKNAFHTRDVDLSVEPDGVGMLKVKESVVDQRGRPRPYSTSVTEARVQIQEGTDAAAGQPVVTVTSAVTRYLGEPEDRVEIPGLVVKLSLVPGRTDAMNLRFDTPRGQGSFGETITRQARRSAAR
jgi:hypothetical protein